MAVVIVQSRATAHVYRVFGALVALLLLMALAVGLVRARADRPPGSPYGTIGAAVRPAASPPTALAAAAPADQTIAPVAGPPAVVAVASPNPTPPGALVRPVPREIAIDKAAAGAAVPQPAPPAVVQAAARAAAAVAPPAAPEAVEPADATASPASTPEKANQTGLVNINTASVDRLNNIPGGGRIGRSIARHRPYRSLEDLVDHRVLKARDFARIKSAITIE